MSSLKECCVQSLLHLQLLTQCSTLPSSSLPSGLTQDTSPLSPNMCGLSHNHTSAIKVEHLYKNKDKSFFHARHGGTHLQSLVPSIPALWRQKPVDPSEFEGSLVRITCLVLGRFGDRDCAPTSQIQASVIHKAFKPAKLISKEKKTHIFFNMTAVGRGTKRFSGPRFILGVLK